MNRPTASAPRFTSRTVSCYWWLLSMAARSELQYRSNLLALAFGGVLTQGVSLMFVGVIAHRFGNLGGWSMSEMGLIYGMRTLSHGLMNMPLGELWNAGTVIRSGEFDRYLLRPVSPYLQLITRRVSLASIGDLVLGVSVLAVTCVYAPIDWSATSIGYLTGAVLGGALLEASILTTLTALEFRYQSTFALKSFVDNILTTFAPYPLVALGNLLTYSLTFVLPLAFIAYLPASFLLGRAGETGLPSILAACSPLAGLPAFVLSYMFFNHQILRYRSVGH